MFHFVSVHLMEGDLLQGTEPRVVTSDYKGKKLSKPMPNCIFQRGVLILVEEDCPDLLVLRTLR